MVWVAPKILLSFWLTLTNGLLTQKCPGLLAPSYYIVWLPTVTNGLLTLKWIYHIISIPNYCWAKLNLNY